jgi:hypothetical protein
VEAAQQKTFSQAKLPHNKRDNQQEVHYHTCSSRVSSSLHAELSHQSCSRAVALSKPTGSVIWLCVIGDTMSTCSSSSSSRAEQR